MASQMACGRSRRWPTAIGAVLSSSARSRPGRRGHLNSGCISRGTPRSWKMPARNRSGGRCTVNALVGDPWPVAPPGNGSRIPRNPRILLDLPVGQGNRLHQVEGLARSVQDCLDRVRAGAGGSGIADHLNNIAVKPGSWLMVPGQNPIHFLAQHQIACHQFIQVPGFGGIFTPPSGAGAMAPRRGPAPRASEISTGHGTPAPGAHPVPRRSIRSIGRTGIPRCRPADDVRQPILRSQWSGPPALRAVQFIVPQTFGQFRLEGPVSTGRTAA